jgi:dTDP-4-dehydrorhamnose reductase
MRILVLGASGMLGFAVHHALSEHGHEVTGALRGSARPASRWCRSLRYVLNVDVENLPAVLRAIEETRSTVVVNATGARLDQGSWSDQRKLFAVNSIFPRVFDRETTSLGVHFIHFSTDGVFSGSQGMYNEQSHADPTDLYGISKLLGEPLGNRSLVLRTSVIGRGISGNDSLVDWFLRQSGTVKGFRRVIFSGLPAPEIARVVATRIIPRPAPLTGLFHMSATPITKYALLGLLREAWSLNHIRIEADDGPALDRSLDSSQLRSALSYTPPPWQTLVSQMVAYYRALDES